MGGKKSVGNPSLIPNGFCPSVIYPSAKACFFCSDNYSSPLQYFVCVPTPHTILTEDAEKSKTIKTLHSIMQTNKFLRTLVNQNEHDAAMISIMYDVESRMANRVQGLLGWLSSLEGQVTALQPAQQPALEQEPATNIPPVLQEPNTSNTPFFPPEEPEPNSPALDLTLDPPTQQSALEQEPASIHPIQHQ
ncbi:hypothetical protein Dimus_034216 [Dionaea muscipula]